MSYFFTSESVSQGHPDKVADQISDAIVDNFIARDRNSHCAVETIVTTGQVVVAGEVKSEAYVDIPEVVRETINRIGYTKSEYRFDGNSCGILNAIHEQSSDIDQGVSRATKEEQGAGDQGIMFGYATNETRNYMPATLDIAHMIVRELAVIRETEPELMPYLRPDSKSQVTIEYSDDDQPLRITDIVVSTQHDDFDEDEAMLAKITEDVINIVIPRVYERSSEKVRKLFNEDIRYYVNPTGKFVIGGPHGDTGLTGRKIIVDTYGGWGAHGGGAFCVDAETEFLSDDLQWHKISEYKEGQKVGQWNGQNGDVEFVNPSKYHVNPAKNMFRFLTDETDQVLSVDHEIVVENEDNTFCKVPVRDVIENGVDGKIPAAFTISEDFNKKEGDEMDEIDVNYILDSREPLYGYFKNASFGELMTLGRALERRAEFDRGRYIAYTTESKADADFVQIVMANYTEKSVHVCPTGHGYEVCVLDRWNIDPGKLEEVRQVQAGEMMYCFTVPSGMLVLRRSGKFFITGNCGKDVSKVDRSAAYMARYLAKNAVAAGVADRMLIQFAYAIGVAEPISLFVNTYGTSHVGMSDGEIADKIKRMFDLRPYAIEQKLKLRNPIYLETASYGHMGQEPRRVVKTFKSRYDTVEVEVELFTWEKLDDVSYFKSEFGL